MRVLVTGAGGYVGSAVVRALDVAGHEPVPVIHHSRGLFPEDLPAIAADLLDVTTLDEALQDVDVVCHMAGLTRARESWHEPSRYLRVNVTGTLNLLDAMQRHGVNRMVFASTGAIYGSPDVQPMDEDVPDAVPHPYAASKRAAELAIEALCHSGKLGAAILRLFAAAGGADPDPTRIVPRVIAAAAGESECVTVNGDGSAVRDILHVDDAAAAFVAAVDRCPVVGEVRRYNIGSGLGSSVMDVVAAAERVTRRSVRVEHRPPAAEPQRLVADPTRAVSELGWKPTRSELDDIVRDAWESARPAGELRCRRRNPARQPSGGRPPTSPPALT